MSLRIAEPAEVIDTPVDHFDGLEKWEDLPGDGRCIQDLWFCNSEKAT